MREESPWSPGSFFWIPICHLTMNSVEQCQILLPSINLNLPFVQSYLQNVLSSDGCLLTRNDDVDFNLEQILPITDESLDRELKVVNASFADPYVLIRRDDMHVTILKADERGEIDELDIGETINNDEWVSGCLYRSSDSNEITVVCLLSPQGSLKVSCLSRCHHQIC